MADRDGRAPLRGADRLGRVLHRSSGLSRRRRVAVSALAPARAEASVAEASGGAISPITAQPAGQPQPRLLLRLRARPVEMRARLPAWTPRRRRPRRARGRPTSSRWKHSVRRANRRSGTFATAVVQGAASGDFSAIDDLVRTAGDAERRALAIQPPGECNEYHRMAVTLLQESRTMITALRDGLKRNDSTALTSLGASAQSMKTRADTLAAAEKALRARFGL